MITLFIKQFLRSKTVLISFSMLFFFGVLGVSTGKVFLADKKKAIDQTISYQEKHIKLQTQLHNDDLGLLLYYLKFSFLNPPKPLSGIAIGQSDIHSNIQHVSILNLEGQKYDTDLVNPMHTLSGNLDMSFVLIFLFPLVIIVLTFNLYSEEIEKGTWTMVKIQGNAFRFLLLKLAIRVVFILLIAGLLFLMAKIVLDIRFNAEFLSVLTLSMTYLLFWFGLAFSFILFRKSSSTNAIVLLSCWLVLNIVLPVIANNYVNNKYPIDDAFAMTIKQRDEYHKRWDTDKKETMEKFYKHYPQFSTYGIKEEGFSWLWYYAMQQMGDDESVIERTAMYEKIRKREQLSARLSTYIPPLQIQLTLNDIAKTSLSHHIDFLDGTTEFHEDLRLQFYPKIFEGQSADSVDWSEIKPKYFQSYKHVGITKEIGILAIISFLLIGFSFLKNIHHFKCI